MPGMPVNRRARLGIGISACLALLGGCGPGTVPDPPAAPAGLTATAGNAEVTVAWTASAGATSYTVDRSTASGGPYTQLAHVTTTQYTDSTVSNGTTFYYVVSAVNSGGASANSTPASATPEAPQPPPAAPTDLQATAGNSSVTLTWAASSGATSYDVQRSTTSGGPYTPLASPTATSYTDDGVTNGVTYFYVVAAIDSAGTGPDSAQVSASPVAQTPTSFGTWINVTPAGVDLTDLLDCGNYGVSTVQWDPMNPSDLYAEFNCQGIWKSTDQGMTWTGPINTGTNGTAVGDCAGGISISPTSTATVPTIYESCIRGSGTGFWKSTDGGVNWTHYTVGATTRQDYYPPVTDPYNQSHLLMTGHEFDSVVQSEDGGQTWTSVPLANGMLQNGGTGFIFFINTGTASTTSGNWLWIAQQAGGAYGTWRTQDGGTTWVQVDKNEHPLGTAQIYQPDTGGVVYMAGQDSSLGQGVLRSSDYGQTWTHVGLNGNAESVVVGTSNDVYSMYGIPVGPGGTTDPAFEVGAQPGNGTWVATATPAGLTQGAAQIQVLTGGSNNVLVGAMWNSGLWRYVEP